MYSVNEL